MLLDLLVLTVSPFIGKGDSSATSNTICKNWFNEFYNSKR